MKVFFFHFNKPASQRKGKVQVSVHHNKKCYIVDNVICNVETHGHINKTQPRFVMKGKCNNISVKNGVAIIN